MIDRIRSLIRLMRSPPPDTSTAAGRSLDRYRRAAFTTLASLAARGVDVVIGLAIVPLVLSYVKADRFGLWMALSGFVAFMVMAEFGMGIGLQNALSDCFGRGDRESPRHFVSTALVLLCCMAGVIVALAMVLLPALPLADWIRTESEEARQDLLPTAQAVLVVFGLHLPGLLFSRICLGYQRGYWGHLGTALSRIVGFLGVVVCVWFRLGLPLLVLCYAGLPNLVALGGVAVIGAKYPHLRPSLGAVRWGAARQILGIGIGGAGLQLTNILSNGVPALIIANRISTSAVTPYAVTNRIVGLAVYLFMTVLTPLWPAYGEAITRGDWGWVRKTFRRSMRITLVISAPIFLGMILAGRWVVRVWTNDAAAVPGFWLLLACSLVLIPEAFRTPGEVFLAGASRLKSQAIYGLIAAGLGIGAGYMVAPTYGAAGVILAMVLLGFVPRALATNVEAGILLRREAGHEDTA